MTIEHKVVLGLEDLKAVSLECVSCKARVTISPDRPRPEECPYCDFSWGKEVKDNEIFLDALSRIRAQIKAIDSVPVAPSPIPDAWPRFRIFLEFDEPGGNRGWSTA